VQVQENEGGSDSEMQGNVVAIEVSQVRTVLSILEAGPQNMGLYQCLAVSARDGEEATASVEISIL
jgi:hypothetical protein